MTPPWDAPQKDFDEAVIQPLQAVRDTLHYRRITRQQPESSIAILSGLVESVLRAARIVHGEVARAAHPDRQPEARAQAAADRLKLWAAANGHEDTQGITEEGWMNLARQALQLDPPPPTDMWGELR